MVRAFCKVLLQHQACLQCVFGRLTFVPLPAHVAASTYHPLHTMGNKQVEYVKQVNDFVLDRAEDIGGILWNATETAKTWMVRLVDRLFNCIHPSMSVRYINSICY